MAVHATIFCANAHGLSAHAYLRILFLGTNTMSEDLFACANEGCISSDEATDVAENGFGDMHLVTQSKKRRHKQSYTNTLIPSLVEITDDPCSSSCKVLFVSKPGGGQKTAVALWPQYTYEGVDGNFVHVSAKESWCNNIIEIKRTRKSGSYKDTALALRECHCKVKAAIKCLLLKSLSGPSDPGDDVLLAYVRARASIVRSCVGYVRELRTHVRIVDFVSTCVRTYVRCAGASVRR